MAGYVPNSPLAALYINTTPGTVANPATMDAAIQAIVQTTNDNFDFTVGLISAETLSKLGAVNVMDYGASGGGIKDDTAPIQKAVDLVISRGGGTVYFPLPEAEYLVSKIDLNNAENVVLTGPPGTIIKMLAGSDYTVDNPAMILSLLSCNNVIIENLTLDGNRDNINVDADISSHNIALESCDRVLIRNVTAKNAGMDGIATRYTVSNLFIDNCVFDNARRNCMSVTREINGLYVTKTTFSNANGTAPQNGVDIEPSGSTGGYILQNIFFDECIFSGNTSAGLAFDIRGNHVLRNVQVNKCRFPGNGSDAIASSLRSTATSTDFKIENCIDIETGVVISNPDTVAVFHSNIEIRGNHFKGVLQLESIKTGAIHGNVFDRSSGSSELLINKDLQNITISKNTFKSPITSGIYRSVEGAVAENITIIDNHIYNKTTSRAIRLVGSLNGISNVIISRNHLYDNGEIAIQLIGVTNGLVSHNIIYDNSNGFRMESSAGVIFENNILFGNATNINTNTVWTGNIRRNNTGYVTENNGVASLLSGGTTIVVTHGMSLAPLKVNVTPAANVGSIWITNITTTQFTINVSAAPGSNTNMYWSASV